MAGINESLWLGTGADLVSKKEFKTSRLLVLSHLVEYPSSPYQTFFKVPNTSTVNIDAYISVKQLEDEDNSSNEVTGSKQQYENIVKVIF